MSSLEGHVDLVSSLVPHPHNPLQLISSSFDGTLKIWSVDDAILLKTIDLSLSAHKREFDGNVYKVKGVKGI